MPQYADDAIVEFGVNLSTCGISPAAVFHPQDVIANSFLNETANVHETDFQNRGSQRTWAFVLTASISFGNEGAARMPFARIKLTIPFRETSKVTIKHRH